MAGHGLQADTVLTAQACIDELRAKRADAISRHAALAEDRRRIAFAAHTGNGEARRKLDTLNRNAAMIAAEIETIGDAISEAESRLAAANYEAAMAAERERAQKAAIKADRLAAAVAEWDATAAKLDELTVSALGIAGELAREQIIGFPPERLFQLSLGRAFRTVFAARLRHIADLELVPPGQRTTLTEASTLAVAAVRAWRDRTCNDNIAA